MSWALCPIEIYIREKCFVATIMGYPTPSKNANSIFENYFRLTLSENMNYKP